MLKAKQDAEEKRQMMVQLQARINKLRTQEDKTKRNIAEAKRQSEFIAVMRDEKSRKREEKMRIENEQIYRENEIKRKIQKERDEQ